MRDQRLDKWAEVLVKYSLGAKPGPNGDFDGGC